MSHIGMPDFIRAVEDFVFVRDEPRPADVLLIPGSDRSAHVLLAARLWREGYAPLVLPSGLHAKGEAAFGVPGYPSEWAWMRALLTDAGVPEAAILREDRATYTWENAQFSRDVLREAGIAVRTAILCCRAPHARRALMYYQAAMPWVDFAVCPAEEPGCNPGEWFRTPEGRAVVLGEVRRLGDQIKEVFAEAVEAAGDVPHLACHPPKGML